MYLAPNVTTEIGMTFPCPPPSFSLTLKQNGHLKICQIGGDIWYMIGWNQNLLKKEPILQDDCQWWDLRKGLEGLKHVSRVSTPTALQPGWAVCQHSPSCTPWHESESPNTASSVNLLLCCFSQGQASQEMRQKGLISIPTSLLCHMAALPHWGLTVWWQGITHPEVEDVKTTFGKTPGEFWASNIHMTSPREAANTGQNLDSATYMPCNLEWVRQHHDSLEPQFSSVKAGSDSDCGCCSV